MMRCEQCGTDNREDAKFCRKCGKPLSKGTGKSKRDGRQVLPMVLAVAITCTLVGTYMHVTRPTPPDNTVAVASMVTDDDGEPGLPGLGGTSASIIDRNIRVGNEQEARNAIAAVASELDLDGIQDQLGDCSVDSTQERTYYRFDQKLDGVKVQGSSLVIGVDRDGVASIVSGNAVPIGDISASAELSVDEARAAVMALGAEVEVYPGSTIVLYPITANEAVPCYRIYAHDSEDPYFVYVSGVDASIVAVDPLTFSEQVESFGTTKQGQAVSFMADLGSDGVYSLYDKGRGITVFDAGGTKVNATSAWEDPSGIQYKYDGKGKEMVSLDGKSRRDRNDEGLTYIGLFLSERSPFGNISVAQSPSSTWSDNSAVSAMHTTAQTYDFYSQVLGRRGFSNREDYHMSVCFNAGNDTNSSWGNTRADALICLNKNSGIELDTVAHEYTHCVERSISNLKYEGEPGALMEATSDIFAELVEDYSDDSQLNNTCDWMQSGSRNLADPGSSVVAERWTGSSPHEAHASSYRQESVWGDTKPSDWFGITNDQGHVHNNSTVLSRAAYLMCNGALADEALTMEELARVLYESFFPLPSDCDFTRYAGWVSFNAREMLSPEKARRVEAAFSEVGLTPMAIRKSDRISRPNTGAKDEAELRAAAERFVHVWYDDWIFAGSLVRNEQGIAYERCKSLIDPSAPFYPGTDEGQKGFISLFPGELHKDFASCVLDVWSEPAQGEREYRVSVRYVGTQGLVETQEQFERMCRESAYIDTWDVTVNDAGLVTKVVLHSASVPDGEGTRDSDSEGQSDPSHDEMDVYRQLLDGGIHEDAHYPGTSHFFTLSDLDGNGVRELIVSYDTDEMNYVNMNVCAVWTIGEDGAPVNLLEHAYRGGMSILADGRVKEVSSGSAFDSHLWVWGIEGERAEKVVSIDRDGSVANQDAGTYYTNADEGIVNQAVDDGFLSQFEGTLEVREDLDWQAA